MLHGRWGTFGKVGIENLDPVSRKACPKSRSFRRGGISRNAFPSIPGRLYIYTSIMYMYIIYAYRHVAGYAHLDTTQIHTDIPFLRSSWCSTGDLWGFGGGGWLGHHWAFREHPVDQLADGTVEATSHEGQRLFTACGMENWASQLDPLRRSLPFYGTQW